MRMDKNGRVMAKRSTKSEQPLLNTIRRCCCCCLRRRSWLLVVVVTLDVMFVRLVGRLLLLVANCNMGSRSVLIHSSLSLSSRSRWNRISYGLASQMYGLLFRFIRLVLAEAAVVVVVVVLSSLFTEISLLEALDRTSDGVGWLSDELRLDESPVAALFAAVEAEFDVCCCCCCSFVLELLALAFEVAAAACSCATSIFFNGAVSTNMIFFICFNLSLRLVFVKNLYWKSVSNGSIFNKNQCQYGPFS